MSTSVYANCPSFSARAICEGSTSPVMVDVKNQCLCTVTEEGYYSCFKVAKPYFSACTTDGTGVLGDANGIIYKTKKGPGTNRFDSDALGSGIDANDSVGKWFHKIRDCNGTSYRTHGCIGIPCNKWKIFKSFKGSKVTICGGAPKKKQIACYSPALRKSYYARLRKKSYKNQSSAQ